MRKLTVLLPLLAIALFPSRSRAGWQDFAPRSFETGILLDAFASHEREEHDDGFRTTRNDLFFREKVTLYSNGYVYHPRFLRYRLSLAGGLKQEQYEASGIDSRGFRSDHALEYEARLFFLPEHPGNLQLFARRWEPLLRERSSTQRNSVQTSNGLRFRYRKRPYFFNTSYEHDTVESGASTSNVENFAVGGQYITRSRSGNEFSLAAGYHPSHFSNSFGLEGDSSESVLSSLLDLQRVRLRTSLSQNDFQQDSLGAGRIESEGFTWVEQLTAYLPLNFRGDVHYRHRDATHRYPQQGAVAGQELSEVDRQLQLSVFHKLYESLDTTYILLHQDRTSDSGESTTLSNSLAVNYSKTIPRGRVLAGSSFSRTDADNRGRAEVPSEPHADIDVPNTFVLGQQNGAQQTVDLQSIAVFLRSPLEPFQIVQLVENVHYTIMPIDVRVEVRIFDLPAPFAVGGGELYDFFVSYALATGSYELRADTFGYHAKVQLFDKLLVPYFSVVTTDSEVRSGVFPGNPLESTTTTVGLASERRALQGRVEHQSVDWDIGPYDSWRLELRSVGAFSETAYGNATTSYLDRRYRQGSLAQSTGPFQEQIASTTASVHKRFPSQGMTLSAGGAFTVTESLVDTKAYSVNSALVWKIGKLDLTLSGTANFADTSGGSAVSTQRSHQYYYAMLRRRL